MAHYLLTVADQMNYGRRPLDRRSSPASPGSPSFKLH
jgi:hypothetical protein